MKKHIIRAALLTVLIAAMTVTAFADQRVYDYAGLFTEEQTSALEDQVANFIGQTGYDMVILTNDEYYSSAEELADDFYDENGFGTTGDMSGMLYLIDMYSRTAWISTRGDMISLINDAREEEIFDYSSYYISDGEYASAAGAAIEKSLELVSSGPESGTYIYDEETGEVIETYEAPNSFSFWEIIIALVLAAAGFFVPLLIVKGQYELSGSTYNYDYVGNSKVKMTGRSDHYIRTSVIRTPKPDNTSDAGGSGVHTSSSGASHGGGGRGF